LRLGLGLGLGLRLGLGLGLGLRLELEMMNKCREEFENWETSNGGAGYDYEVWQAAWNARQPEAKILDELKYHAFHDRTTKVMEILRGLNNE